jgi:uncharacterized protein (DUF1501 family)
MQSTRRQFLAGALGSSALISFSSIVPRFLLAASEQNAAASGDNVLVVVQLSGGNDGLNTVIPYADEEYRKNRFTLAIDSGVIRKIDDAVGFHYSMEGFSKLLEDSRLAILQGVGYPNPNRSHFESMDLWHTAHRKDANRPVGWLGRYLDADRREGGDAPALHFGAEPQPLALAAEKVQTPSVVSLERFRLETNGRDALRRTVEEVAAVRRAQSTSLLDFVQDNTRAALASSRRVEQALGSYDTPINYPGTGLSGKLKSVAQLIDAGLSTRIYYVTLDGFDNHSNQAQAHAGLLAELTGAVSAFLDDMAHHGHSERVLLMTFSEFGRRVVPGVHGPHPSLTDLDDGDLKHHTDYRRVYATVLDRWLSYNSDAILGDHYDPLEVIKS